MLDMGFLPSIRQSAASPAPKAPDDAFSATMPADIQYQLTKECLRDPAVVKVAHDVPLETVAHALYPVREHLKADLLLSCCAAPVPLGAGLYAHQAPRQAPGIAAAESRLYRLLASGKPVAKLQRRAAMDGFSQRRLSGAVATDIARAASTSPKSPT